MSGIEMEGAAQEARSARAGGSIPAQTPGLHIDAAKCVGCGKCLRACASGGIELVGEKPHRAARPTDSCILCGMCVETCPFGAIEIVRPKTAERGGGAGAEAGGAEGVAGSTPSLADYCNVWVFAQMDGAEPAPVVFELLGKGRELADAKGCRLVALLGLGAGETGDGREDTATDTAGADVESAPAADPATSTIISRLIACGADEVLLCRGERLAHHDAEAYGAWICGLVEERQPDILLFGATDFGRELAPGVAARVRTGLTADCTVLAIDPATGLLQQTRPAFGGNLMATLVGPDHRPQMATVRPGVLPAPVPDPARRGVVTQVPLPDLGEPRVRVVETLATSVRDTVTDAKTLVVAGRGIGSQKNLPLMQRLADLLGGKLACTRPLVEAGWCEYWHQVGQTGCSVAPKLLVSVGVSGAIQHLAGIGGAQTVIAVNTDPDAPIFGMSDYNVVGDGVEVARELVALLEARAIEG